MKRNLLFQYRPWYLVLSTMLLGSFMGHSQNTIYESDQFSEYSIIRNYLNNVDITYNLIGHADGDIISFNYVDRNAMTVQTANLPQSMRINDFTVYNDSVFFCGYDSGCAIYGFFNIYNLFFNSGALTYFKPDTAQIAFLNKIEVKKTSSGEIHMVMIGSKNPFSSKAGSLTFVADAWLCAMGINHFYYAIDYNNKHQFNDVALTGKFAVVSTLGSDNGTPNSHNVFYYTEPASPDVSYLDSWPSDTVPGWQADPAILLASAPIRITKMGKNEFATVCNTALPGKLVVSIFSNPTNPPASRFELPYNYSLGEIVYNTLSKNLFILPIVGNYLGYTQFPFSSTTKVSSPYGGWTSIDNIQKEPFEIISGWYATRVKSYWLFDYTDPNSSCISVINNNNNTMEKNDQEITFKHFISRLAPSPNNASVEITQYNLEIICR